MSGEISLEKIPIFRNIPNAKIHAFLESLNVVEKTFKKNQTILHIGDITHFMSIVIYGSVNIESNNYDGQKIIIGRIEPGEIFAETYAFSANEPLMVNVVANEKTKVLFLDARRLAATDMKNSSLYAAVTGNLLKIFAQKNLHLSRRIMHTTPRTIRERLLLFLDEQVKKCGSRKFTIPFDRQQLADYLNVDRSALSHELGKLQKENILFVKKNYFELM